MTATKTTFSYENEYKSKPYSILVTGATGFVGNRLISGLVEKGYKVKAISRKNLPSKENVKFVQADAFDIHSLSNAMKGTEVAFYLLHSMEDNISAWRNFAEREKFQAENFLKAAEGAGVKRIIYLGGLVSESISLSPHMQSRKQVGEILASGKIPVTELRASIIIGSGGGSYAMLRYLAERLRVMVCPKWVKSLAQPIAVDDVVKYLVGVMENSITSGKIFEIGGPEKMTYEKLMRIYAKFIKKNIFIIQIPFLTTRLSSYWVDLITPVKASLARPLVDSLVHDTVVTDDKISKIIPFERKTVIESIEIATKEMAASPPETDTKTEKTGFKVNQKILMLTFIGFAICGTTYYWIDDRPDVYSFGWILGSIIWYTTISFGIIFVYNKTRLGYVIGGILSWVTLAFWTFDNYHIAFQMSIISQEPNFAMVVRNFVGIAIALVAVVSSHNLFHKVIDYQYRGKPLE
uniref:NAD dependent epimerase/dehydratase family protein n=1 Tax=uncultured marine thaumarchaeote AD1000_69_E02 TaxID=1455932 RepID=A0A075FVG4_9ARCH|nr:NAD dependent epimerase/dehydratase family protein [uncultured marine thaumarchaeote AD1000_69_E02]